MHPDLQHPGARCRAHGTSNGRGSGTTPRDARQSPSFRGRPGGTVRRRRSRGRLSRRSPLRRLGAPRTFHCIAQASSRFPSSFACSFTVDLTSVGGSRSNPALSVGLHAWLPGPFHGRAGRRPGSGSRRSVGTGRLRPTPPEPIPLQHLGCRPAERTLAGHLFGERGRHEAKRLVWPPSSVRKSTSHQK
jgi:hypothetical protein